MRRAVVSAVILTLCLGVARTAEAQGASGLAAIEFDEIDHVYTTGAVPPPGSFRQNAGQVVQPPASEQPKKNRGILAALGAAGNVLGGASSGVASSGEIGRVLRISDSVARVVPIANAMGLAGARKFDALVQTYVLARVSPTGAVLLQGFLAAQADYKSRFPSTRSAAPQGPPPAELEPYAKGALRHYTIASNGWVRIDDPATKTIVIIKPDAGKSYVVDTSANTVRVSDYARPATGADAGVAGGTGSAAFADQVESLGPTTLDGVSTIGFRTRSTIRVAGAGTTCPDTTITSTRVEYFAPYHVSSDAANTVPAAQAPDSGGCAPKTSARHGGAKIPADQLVMYQANTIDKQTSAGEDHYTMVIERGNLREQTHADPATFEVPPNVRQVATAQP